MNKDKLKQIFSLENISANLQRSLRRFPVALTMLVALTAFSSYLVFVNNFPDYGFIVIFYLTVGMVLDFAVSIWGDEQSNRKRYYTVKGVLLGVWTVYCIWLYFHQRELMGGENIPFVMANIAWITALVLSIPFVSFHREKNDVQAWHFSVSLCKAILISALITGIFAIGLNTLIVGTAALFAFDVSKETYAVTNIVCCLLLSGFLFLNLVPAGERKHDSSTDMPRFLTNVVKWLLLPLLACYMVVLYVYSVTIIAKWELPKGLISWLVSAVMGGYLLGYVILYPQLLTDAQSWLTKLFTRWIPAFILPLLVLMTVGVIRRFSDYGLTAPRLYLVTLLVWYYAVCILIIIFRCRRLHWIFLSVAALFLLSSGHPLNYYRICEKVLKSRVETLLAIESEQRTDAEQYELREQLHYLRSTYGEKSIEAFHADSLLAWDYYYDTYETVQQLDSTWYINYSNWKVKKCPQGRFSTFRSKDYYHRQDATVTDGILKLSMVVDNLDYPEILLLDTAEIRQASRDTTQLFIYTKSGNYVYVPTKIKVEPEPNDSIYLRIEGYLFGK